MKTSLLNLTMTLLFVFNVACRQPAEKTTELKIEASIEAEKQNEELVKQYIEIINTGNFETLKEVLSADYVIYSPSGHPKPTSRESLIENYKEAGKSFSRFAWNIKDIITTKDKVVCRIMVSGIYNSGTSGLTTTKKEFNFSLISIMRIENGIIAEEWQEDDQLGFARQLGMELKPIIEENG